MQSESTDEPGWRGPSRSPSSGRALRRPGRVLLMLDLAILGLLHEQELHGYEIRRRLRDELGLFANISFGSLYPALSRLESTGAVTVTESTGTATAAAHPAHRFAER